MSDTIDQFVSTGKVTAIKDGIAVFAPRGTNYELHLLVPAGVEVPLHTPVDVRIRCAVRKLWTVPSGGNFVTPIFGPPRIVQGRVRFGDEKQLVVHAGANFIIDLPAADDALDLTEGPVTVNRMVNVTILPGASMEFVRARGAVAAPVAPAQMPVEHMVDAATSGAAEVEQ
jgi:hypothetical protein